MNRRGLLIIAALAITGSAAQAQVPGFKHIQSIPLSSQFDSANSKAVGVRVTDVAFDGTHAYVVGLADTSSTAGQGVLRIADVLTSPSVDTAALFSDTTVPQGFDSRILFDSVTNQLLVVLGAGNATNSSGVFAVSTSGVLNTSYGVSGFSNRNTFTGNGSNGTDSIDTIAIDPVAQTSGRRIAGFLRNRGFEWMSSDDGNPGSIVRNYFHDVAQLAGGPRPANWVNIFRGMAFDPSGNLYMHDGVRIIRMNRRAASGGGFGETASAFNNVTAIIALNGTTQRTISGVAYVPATASHGSFVAYNDRSTATDSDRPGIYIGQVTSGTEASGTWGEVASLTGAEPIGTNVPAAWTEAQKNVRFFTSGGKQYLFVTTGGVNDRLDIYEVTAPAVTVSGTLDLGAGWSGSYSAPGAFSIELRNGTTVVESTAANVAVDGTYSFTTAQQGTYDVVFKGPHWLSRIKTGVVIGSGGATGVNTDVVNGDVDGDDVVSVFDYIALSDAFDSDPNSTTWNPAADLDQDGVVSVFDYIILSDNFDKAGDLQS